MDLPQGFSRVLVGGALVVHRDGLGEALVAAGVADPDDLVRRSPSVLAGRARLARIDLGVHGAALVRPLTRGGLFGRVVRRASLDPDRALNELRVAAAAAARGAPVADVLAAVTRRDGLAYRHAIVTREVEGARDLQRVLGEEAPGGRARRAAIAAAGRAVRALHEAGVDHVDLNLRNVLLAPDGRALVIDLDRCRVGADAPLAAPARERNLLRLLRSWAKLRAAAPASTLARDPVRLARAYCQGDEAALRRLVERGRAARFTLRRFLWRLLGTST